MGSYVGVLEEEDMSSMLTFHNSTTPTSWNAQRSESCTAKPWPLGCLQATAVDTVTPHLLSSCSGLGPSGRLAVPSWSSMRPRHPPILGPPCI